MAAASPRNPRRTKGRHRKPTVIESSNCAHWLRVGTVGIGLGAAIASGQGIAAAAPDDSSNSGPAKDASDTASTAQQGSASGSTANKAGPKRPPTTKVSGQAGDTNDKDTPHKDTVGGSKADSGPDTSGSTASDQPAAGSSNKRAQPQIKIKPNKTSDADSPSSTPSAQATPATEPAVKSDSGTTVNTPAPSAAVTAAEPSTTVAVTAVPAVAAAVSNAVAAQTASTPVVFTSIADMLNWVGQGLEESLALAIRNTRSPKGVHSPSATTTTGPPAPATATGAPEAAAVTPISPSDAVATLTAAYNGNTSVESQHEAMQFSLQPTNLVNIVLAPVINAISLLGDLAELGTAVLNRDGVDVVDEIGDVTRDLIGMIPVVGQPIAAGLYHLATPQATTTAAATATATASVTAAAAAAPAAAATPAVGTAEWYFQGVLTWAVNRLAGWPGTPGKFVDITNNQVDQTLDQATAQLQNLIDNAIAGSPARWVNDLLGIFGMFFQSAIPNYTFTNTLNAWGDFLNRIVPPFTIDSGAGTFGIITAYKIMGAAVVGTATVLQDMLNGVYDPVQIEKDVVKATTGADSVDMTAIALSVGFGDGGAFSHPERAWNITLPTWTADQVNPFTIVTYVALVGIYKRFQEMAALQTYTTSTTYENGLQTAGLTPETASEYAYGTFHVVDQAGRPVNFFGVSQGGTYTSAWGAQVTINNADGGYSYTNTLPGPAFFAAGAAGQYDTVNIPVTSADGAPYTLTFKIKILTVANTPLPGTSFTTSTTYNSGYPSKVAGSEYAYGSFHAVDQNGNAASYSPAAGNTYTSAWGALVTINSAGGGFSYTQTLPSSAYFHAATSDNPDDRYDTVQVTVKGADGQNYLVTQKIQIVGGTNANPTASPTTGAADGLGVVRGSVGGSDSDGDQLTYSLVGSSVNGLTGNSAYTKNGANNGGIVTLKSDGTFTYVSTSTAGATQSFQVQMTDAHGGSTITTVTVPNTTSLTPANINTSTQNVVTGSVPTPVLDTGMFTYTLGAAPSKGTVTSWNAATGAFTYARDPNLGHTVTPGDVVTVIATDANGRTVSMSFAVNPGIANSAPVGAGLTTDSPVGAPVYTSVGVLNWSDIQQTTGTLHATDPNNDAVHFASGTYTTTNGGSVTVNADGTFSYTMEKDAYDDGALIHTHDPYWHHVVGATDTFTVNVSDDFGGTTAVTYAVPIASLNKAPTLSGGVASSSTSGLGVVRGSISSASDGDGDTVTYRLLNTSGGSAYGTNGGIVTMSGTSFTYVPKVGVSSDSFQVQADDGHGGVTTATVTLSGLGTPSPQTNTNAAGGVTNGSLNVPAGDTGLGLTYSLGTGPSKGTVVVNADGTYTYTRTAGLGHTTTPNDSFTINATDATGKSVVIATINVAPTVANTAPVGNGVTVASSSLDRIVGPYDKQSTSGTLKALDAEGDSVTWAAGTYNTANGGTITVAANGSFTYSLQKYAWFGVSDSYWHDHAVVGDPGDTFTVAISDAFGGTTNATYAIPIEKQNAAPTLSGSIASSSTSGLGVVRGTISGASDGDGDTVTYRLLNTSGGSAYTTNGGIVTMSGTSFTYVPKVGVSSDSFQVQADDGHGGLTTATVTLSGLSTPSPQTNTNGVPGSTSGSLNVPAGDTGLGLTYSLGTGPSKGTVVVNADGTYTYTRTSGLGHTTTPNDSFTIKATDATGKSVIIATINVAPTVSNSAPVATVNGSSGTVTLSGPGSKTNPNAAGVQTITGLSFVASDADSDSLLINNKFDGTGTTFALASGGTIATANGGTVTVNSNGTMSYSISQSAAYFHAAAKMGATAAQKTDWFNFTVTDGYGGTSTVMVVIPIYAENRDPTTSAVKVGNSWTSIKATDPDGETISTTKLSAPPSDANPGSGYIVSTGDSLTGSLNLGTAALTKFSGFTITVYDGYWRTSNGVVTSTPGQKQV
ncbi:Ig-like domain-containing protein [Mycobacterium sp. DL592]|uniref:beta strand repeat-containing protein n=1 Tax=Mycobacterium sp. DL592 TaxID=2675524 RepID=UPI001421CF2D|nr:Ig-like domain-containing protein [Mycobacterium sp. DL592]